MRRTKIIITLGPATDSPERLRQLMQGGVNVFRLNMSHARHDWVREVTKNIRAISADMGLHVSLLLDTQGPAIRTGDLPNKIELKPGDRFTFTVRGTKSEEQNSVDVNYDDLVDDIAVGDVVLVDNGVIRMKVLSKAANQLHCEVLTPGLMGSRRHINLPGVKVNLPALTAKDLEDIDIGVECGVDYIALSFVREANDVQTLRQLLATKGADIRIVAKIEDQQAVKNLNEIIDTADGVMVARGDLGIECPYEELPIIQRRIVKTCIQELKPVIVATHMLESMIQNPMPTRAEITDVANAVYEQADAIMLSGETTVGAYPLECVTVLDRVAERIERSGGAGYTHEIELTDDHQRVVASGIHLADQVGAAALCVFTRTGMLATVTAGMRPKSSLIYAFTPDEAVCRRLMLNYGIRPFQLPFPDSPNQTVSAAEKLLRARRLVKPGDKLVFITDMRIEGHRVDSVQLHIIK